MKVHGFKEPKFRGNLAPNPLPVRKDMGRGKNCTSPGSLSVGLGEGGPLQLCTDCYRVHNWQQARRIIGVVC